MEDRSGTGINYSVNSFTVKYLAACLVVIAWRLVPKAERPASPTVVIQNYYYAKPGKADEVLQWRIHACAVLKEMGVRPGRVLKPVPKNYKDATIQDVPDAIWMVEYPDTVVMREEAKKVMSTGKFEPVMKHMDSLCKDFKRIYSVVASE